MDGICSTLQTRFDRNRPLMFFMAVLILSLNISDALCTQFIIAQGGWKVTRSHGPPWPHSGIISGSGNTPWFPCRSSC